MGEEPPSDTGDVPGGSRRPPAADPGGSRAARLPTLRGAQAPRGAHRLRGRSRAARASVRAASGRGRPLQVAVPGDHRRRVPGRERPPAGAPRHLARRARRALRGGRRLPGDLLVHRRHAPLPDRASEAVPARGRDQARDELPLDAGGARARQPPRAAARRGPEAAALGGGRRPGASARAGGRRAWLGA